MHDDDPTYPEPGHGDPPLADDPIFESRASIEARAADRELDDYLDSY